LTYAISAALQAAVYQKLFADPALASVVGSGIHDVVPSGPVPDTYVTLGPEQVLDRSDKSGFGALHRFTVSVVTDAAGFSRAKIVGAAVCDALNDADLVLSRGRLVALRFDRATARRIGTGSTRQIDLRFSARVEDS
jgi:Protein of unknown function (DUF3168)